MGAGLDGSGARRVTGDAGAASLRVPAPAARPRAADGAEAFLDSSCVLVRFGRRDRLAGGTDVSRRIPHAAANAPSARGLYR